MKKIDPLQFLSPLGRPAAVPRITRMARLRFAPISAQQMHGMGNRTTHELLHVLHGKDRVITRFGSCVLNPGDTVLIPAGVAHRDQFNLAEGLEVFMVIFKWPGGRSFLSLLAPDAPYKIRAARARKEAAAIIENMQMDLAGGRDVDRVVAQSRLLTILFTMARDWMDRGHKGRARSRRRGAGLRRSVLIQRACIYMRTHYQDNISLNQVARALGVSACYLSHIFSAGNNWTVVGYLTRARMEKARELLNHGKMNIGEIARAVGYEDNRYFAKVFYKYFGFPPRLLRV